ncbi:HD-GYP domain-containing protein [Caldimonas tepidiphila]|uniref:HD-GYP domain-containing protein n=1 Tax=Caldimonas tepidiphila TaxID=2315841 RepID=UPI000E5A6BC0|nr:HD-GYP domain-containing protein [Caldimonas tepidiphila]
MLKRIPIAQLRPGMHVHELCSSWLDHPFWRSSFRVDDATDLRRLAESGVSECWIDTDRGLDVASAPDTASSEGALLEAAAAAPAVQGASRPARATLDEELHRAALLCQKGRQAVVSLFGEVRLGQAVDPERCLPLVDDITQSVLRNPGALVSLARLKSTDDYTYMHSVAVCALMVALARQLGLDEEQMRLAGMAGLFHDIGKAVMPQDILNKPGSLSEQEFAIIKSHPLRGHELLSEARMPHEVVLDVCLHHHEKLDGSGYPHRLEGAEISLFAKMGAVCDVYDAITSDRPYKAGWDPGEAIKRMAEWTRSRSQFDNGVFQAFVKSIGIYPTGSLVRLKSGRLGVVLEQHEKSLLTPTVKVFFSIKSKMRILPEVIELGSPSCQDRIVARESAGRWGLGNVDELWAGPAALRRG